MIDTKLIVRKAYFNALNGRILYNGNPITVSDEILPKDAPDMLYVIIANQSGSQENTFEGWRSVEDIDLDIVYKANTRGAKEPLDNIANQIFGILFPYRGAKIPSDPGIQINCARLESDRYIPLSLNSNNSVNRRILTFRQHVVQTN